MMLDSNFISYFCSAILTNFAALHGEGNLWLFKGAKYLARVKAKVKLCKIVWQFFSALEHICD